MAVQEFDTNGANYVLIDTSTGEKVNEYSGNIKITNVVKSEYEKTHTFGFQENKKYVKLYSDAAFILAKQLKPKELQILFGLTKFVSYEDCSIKIGNTKASHYATISELAEAFEIPYSTFANSISALIKKGIIGYFVTGDAYGKKEEIKAYFVNPYLYMYGCNPSSDVLKLFDDTGWKEMFEKGI